MNTRANERTLRIAACLGVDGASAGRSHELREEKLAREAARLDASLSAGGVALVTGPSGAGKSTLLSQLPETGRVDVKALTRVQSRTRVASLCARLPMSEWAGLLARFGLAEAGVLVSCAGDLSAGERARLELAIAAARCERLLPGHITLVVDEWCSVLDRATAASVASGAARWARQRGVRLIGATAHGDLAASVGADIVGKLNGQGGVEWTVCGLNAAG